MGTVAAELLQLTPKPFDFVEVEERFPTLYEESTNTVIKQEVIRYNRLLKVMIATLPQFQKALKGLVTMTEELESMGNAFFTNQVPENFEKKGYLSLKPLSSWSKDLVDRIKFVQQWVDGGLPIIIWLSGLFFPQAFFTGTLQNFARSQQIAIDRLGFSFNFLNDQTPETITEKAEKGVHTFGIFFEGCRYDRKLARLEDAYPKVLYDEMPPCNFVPEADRKPPPGMYECPIYKVLSRKGTLMTTGHSTNFVLNLDTPTDRDPASWIRGGVAGFLALKD